MPLPQIQYPINEVYLRSLDRTVKYRPFLVKEEKLLLIAREADDLEEMKTAVKQVVQNCCLEDIDVSALPLFDLEMFFVHLRAKSVGEKAKLSFVCQNTVDGKECGNTTNFEVDLTKIHYDVAPNHNPVIQLGAGIGVKMKYPNLNVISEQTEVAYDAALRVIRENIEYIFDEESVYPRETISNTELDSFIENLSVEQIDAIRDFFITIPKVVLEETINCKKCGYEHKVLAENIYSFFT